MSFKTVAPAEIGERSYDLERLNKTWQLGLDRFMSSRFAWSVTICALICLSAGMVHFGKRKPDQFTEQSWTTWAVADFLQARQNKQLVFLGSSLVLVPVDGVDANYLSCRLDGSQHHKSFYFEHKLKELSGLSVNTFNLALPGEMPSDAYLITDFLLKGAKQPAVIIYGLGPRDFMDNSLQSPAATDPFANLSRLGDIDYLRTRMMPDWLDQLNFLISKIVYFYGARLDLNKEAEDNFQHWLNQILPTPANCRAYTIWQRREILPFYKPSELVAGEAFFSPVATEFFSDNLDEYRKRYGVVRWDTFTTQMTFFAQLLDIARQRNIHVVVVSMPITNANRSLLKDYAWDAYRQSLHVLAMAKHASYIDLQNSGKFERSDFRDTVHLNAKGGRKMLDLLASQMSTSQDLLKALKSNDSLAKQNANNTTSGDTTSVGEAGLF